MSDWDSEKYLKFEKERTQPAVDLVNRISLENPAKIVDIGCGPGNSTGVLAKRFPNAKIIGVDSSENMIAAARKKYPELEFRVSDASGDLTELGTNFDLVFSNACIQWIEGHDRLLPNLMKLLRAGGILAVQTPMIEGEPIHKQIEAVTSSEKYQSFFKNAHFFHNLTQEGYFDLLSELSEDFSMWMTTYCHAMDSYNAIREWYRSTGLRPYLDALPDERRPLFEQEILEGIQQSYPQQKNGKVIFRFPRFFFTAAAKD